MTGFTAFSPNAYKLVRAFRKAGFSIRLVGGAVRDLMMGIEPKDYDFCTPATPDEMQQIAKVSRFSFHPTGIQHGTATIVVGGESFEVTTLRFDKETDGRHAVVVFTDSYQLDAARRDFTFNAMSYDIETQTLYDYFNGMGDIKRKVVRFVGSPTERVQEDYLRILRYFRFAARFAYEVDAKTIRTITSAKNLQGLKRVSVERYWLEMQKLLIAPGAPHILKIMQESGVLETLGLRYNPSRTYNGRNPIVALSTLVEDVDVFTEMWKFSAEERELLKFLCYNRSIKPPTRDHIRVRSAVQSKQQGYLAALCDLQGDVATSEYARDLVVPKFPVTGNDLIPLGIKPGPAMGSVIQGLKVVWALAEFKPSREELLDKARQVLYK